MAGEITRDSNATDTAVEAFKQMRLIMLGLSGHDRRTVIANLLAWAATQEAGDGATSPADIILAFLENAIRMVSINLDDRN